MTDRIGRYEILSSIGAGGMSTVYRARLVGPARAAKEVALKVIHPHLSQNRDFVMMFLDEMRLAMGLAHRNVVQTFDAGKAEETYFLVMELVNGLSLRDLLDLLGSAERMPLDLVLFVAAEVSAALDYAHKLEPGGHPGGVVHRDVSPGNILLSSQGDVKLTDFGVAKVAGHLAAASSKIVLGKLSYMAPEQALGGGDPRSDVFALGAVTFEMLRGEPMRVAQELRDVLRHPSPDPRRLAEVPGLRASLRELVMSCLDPQPQNRPATAGELQRRLADEIFRLPRNPRLTADAHARLQSYMALTLEQHPQQVQASEKTSALAKILLEEVRSLAGRPGTTRRPPPEYGDERPVAAEEFSALAALHPSGETSPLPPPAVVARRRQDLRSLAARLPDLRRWRRLLPWAGVALGLVCGVALSWMVMRRAPRTAAPARATAQAQRADAAPRARLALSGDEAAPPTAPRRVASTRTAHSHAARVEPHLHGTGATRGPRHRRLVISSTPSGAEVFEGSHRLGRTPLPVTSTRARTLGVYARGYEPRELKIAAGATSAVAVKLKRSELAQDATSLRQLRALRESGQISEFSYRRRRAELISQKLLDLKVQRKIGQITDEQYRRLVESVREGNE